MATHDNMPLLDIRNLCVDFHTLQGTFHALENIDIRIDAGEIIGVAGESGSGKSVTMLALMGLLPSNTTVSADKLMFAGSDLHALSSKRRRDLNGKEVAMIFQDPLTSLNPAFSIGFQLIETIKTHQDEGRAHNKARALDLLEQVQIPSPHKRLYSYPHELSGGMCQRVMIAMAIACKPKLLIADEPTTALDATIAAQILDLLYVLHEKTNMAVVLISHDLAVLAQTTARIYVMYAGQIMEENSTRVLFNQPKHPYTHALLKALPEYAHPGERLPSIPGQVPGHFARPSACLFEPRCPYAQAHCRNQRPPLDVLGQGHVRCYYPLVSECDHE